MIKAAKIITKLLKSGELSSIDDAELFEHFHEVRDELDIYGEEMGFSLHEINSTVYLIPNMDSDILTYSLKKVRESESSSANLKDAFLQCYITMTILWLLYGGKNKDPLQYAFLQISTIVAKLDERLNADNSELGRVLEEDCEINFKQIAEHWKPLHAHDEENIKRKTRMGRVLTACRFLEREGLVNLRDNELEVRPTKRLNDLMQYYLNNDRIKDIHCLFDNEEVL